ncbi:MAG: YbaK/EbsC family protein [Anaerolineae bacterium]|nr:YbaK/EbsC family protein [Anaerolineae bacterium]
MHPATQRVVAAAAERGLSIDVVEFAQSTRTAQAAADAIGCDVAQIVKSLCFSANDAPVMALVSGANMLDTKKVAGELGIGRKKVKRADADQVRAATGFAIGGVPPFGHAEQMIIFIDADLMQFDEIWAAAGTPNTVFPIAPEVLCAITEGKVIDLRSE